MNRLPTLIALALFPVTGFAQSSFVGDPCHKDDPAPRDGLVCALAYTDNGQPDISLHEPMILNAQRGDLVLSGGCSGDIGGLFAELDPAQRYSHEGIITDNLGTRITHTTASMERLLSDDALQVIDPWLPDKSEGVDPGYLKFGWPGGLHEPVMHAYEGATLADPSGVPYTMDSFSADDFFCEAYSAIYPQLVVTFPREYLIEEIGAEARAKLGEASALLEADSYDTTVGGTDYPSHYRWYHYTNGALRDKGIAPQDPFDWWSETLPGASSTSIWSALARTGVHLEGDKLESGHDEEFSVELIGENLTDELANDLDQGVNMDGMYLYTEEERRIAAAWMHQEVYNRAFDKMSGAQIAFGGEYTFQAATDAANQFVNCMAFDWCGEEEPRGSCKDGEGHAKDSECWRDPGIGIAAAPEDFLSWDAPNPDDPSQSGVLGHDEKVIYKTDGMRWGYTWSPDEGTGTIGGMLYGPNGAPLEEKAVTVLTVLGDELVTTTCCTADGEGEPGSFEVEGIPAGPAEVHACMMAFRDDGLVIPGPWFAGAAMDVVPTEALGDEPYEMAELLLAQQDCLSTVLVSEKTREVSISGIVEVIEDDVTHDDKHTYEVDKMLPLTDQVTVILNPFAPPATPYGLKTAHTFAMDRCTDDPDGADLSEIQMKVDVEVRLAAEVGPDIEARVVAKMFEGESCPNGDLDKTWVSGWVTVPAGIGPVSIQTPTAQVNEEWPDTDRFRLKIDVRNDQAPVPPEFQ